MTTPADPNRPGANLTTNAPDPVLPRAALERVLARATELQTVGGEDTDGVSESRIMEIAREVGIDTANLRQALAEERARLPMQEQGGGVMLDALGPAAVSVQRVVPGTPAEVLARLEAWMPKMESLSVRRRTADRVSWEPRHDPMGNFFRALGMGGRRLDLVRLDQLVASVTAIDDRRSVVRFDAESYSARRTQRTTVIALLLGLAFLGAGLSVPIAFLASSGTFVGGAMATIAALVGGAGFASWRLIRRAYREMIDRTHLRLEQLLDELERGGMQPPPSLAQQVTAALLR